MTEPAYQPRPNLAAPLVICLRCGALVDYNAVELHDAWHEEAAHIAGTLAALTAARTP
jgi:hypothetical protein